MANNKLSNPGIADKPSCPIDIADVIDRTIDQLDFLSGAFGFAGKNELSNSGASRIIDAIIADLKSAMRQ